MTKCPYVPPHPWNVDFPHLMLRAKAVKNRDGGARWRDTLLSSTDTVGRTAEKQVVSELVTAGNPPPRGRKRLQEAVGVHPQPTLPKSHSSSLRAHLKRAHSPVSEAQAA